MKKNTRGGFFCLPRPTDIGKFVFDLKKKVVSNLEERLEPAGISSTILRLPVCQVYCRPKGMIHEARH